MLYSFKKYKPQPITSLDVKHRAGKFVTATRGCIIMKVSAFHRKMFIRSLLMYTNMLNCNFFYTPDQNFFYFNSFMYITHSTYHPSIYYKYRYVR